MNGAVLAVCPTSGVPQGSPATIASAHEDRVRAIGDLLLAAGGRVVASDGELVLGAVPGAVAALAAALDVLRGEPSACIGVAWGEAPAEGPPTDVDVARARRLAWRSPAGVRCTEAFRSALGAVPAGVGLFEVPHDLAHRLGFSAFELSDHRG